MFVYANRATDPTHVEDKTSVKHIHRPNVDGLWFVYDMDQCEVKRKMRGYDMDAKHVLDVATKSTSIRWSMAWAQGMSTATRSSLT